MKACLSRPGFHLLLQVPLRRPGSCSPPLYRKCSSWQDQVSEPGVGSMEPELNSSRDRLLLYKAWKVPDYISVTGDCCCSCSSDHDEEDFSSFPCDEIKQAGTSCNPCCAVPFGFQLWNCFKGDGSRCVATVWHKGHPWVCARGFLPELPDRAVHNPGDGRIVNSSDQQDPCSCLPGDRKKDVLWIQYWKYSPAIIPLPPRWRMGVRGLSVLIVVIICLCLDLFFRDTLRSGMYATI